MPPLLLPPARTREAKVTRKKIGQNHRFCRVLPPKPPFSAIFTPVHSYEKVYFFVRETVDKKSRRNYNKCISKPAFWAKFDLRKARTKKYTFSEKFWNILRFALNSLNLLIVFRAPLPFPPSIHPSPPQIFSVNRVFSGARGHEKKPPRAFFMNDRPHSNHVMLSVVDRARLLFVILSATRAVGEVNITLLLKLR